MFKKLIIIFSLMLISSTAYSECTTGYCIGVGTDVVQSASVYQDGVLFMAPTDGLNLGCSLLEGFYIKLDDTHPQFEEIYATYLTAIATKQRFQIRVDNSPTCTVSYIRVWN